jgi:hypothetical protein
MNVTPAVMEQGAIRTSLSIDRVRVFGEFVDRLVTLDVQTRSQHLGLYEAARNLAKQPLCLAAAEAILRSLKPGKPNTAVFTTGFFSPAYFCGEQDGPVGIACLARALETGIGVRSIILTDDELVPGVEATCVGAGYKTFDIERALTVPKGRGIAVVGISKDANEALKQVKAIMDRAQPSFVMASERPSGNAKGEYHNLRGLNMTALTGKTDCVLEEAVRRGIPTIAVGDGGNELGYGALQDAIASVRPNNARCQCPCGGTVASHVAADVVVHSAVSNWGVYGIIACLAVLLDDARVAPIERVVERALQRAADTAGDDGRLGWVDIGSDGVDGKLELGVVGLLRTMALEMIEIANPRRVPTYGIGDG